MPHLYSIYASLGLEEHSLTKQKAHNDYWDAENGKLNRFCPQGQRKELAGKLKIWEDAITNVIAYSIRDGVSLAPADVKAAVIGLVKSNTHSIPSMTIDAAFQQ